ELRFFDVSVERTCVKERRILSSDRKRQVVANGMEPDVVPENVSFQRLDEGVSAALETLEEIRAAEPHESPARSGQVRENTLLRRGWRLLGMGRDIVAQAVPGQREGLDSSDDVRSIETGILIVRIVVPDRESKGPGDPS